MTVHVAWLCFNGVASASLQKQKPGFTSVAQHSNEATKTPSSLLRLINWPAVHQTLAAAAVNGPHVWREVHLAGVTSHHVTFEDLLLVESEAVLGAKDQDLVVHGLAGQPLACSGETGEEGVLKRASTVCNDAVQQGPSSPTEMDR